MVFISMMVHGVIIEIMKLVIDSPGFIIIKISSLILYNEHCNITDNSWNNLHFNIAHHEIGR